MAENDAQNASQDATPTQLELPLEPPSAASPASPAAPAKHPSFLARVFRLIFGDLIHNSADADAAAAAAARAFSEPPPDDRQPETRPQKGTPLDDGKAWIGVDLDGTLARSGAWNGLETIGEPVPLMLTRVQRWLELGLRVKIFTARASRPEAIPHIRRWLEKNGLPADLEITNQKDFSMLECWDDRAVQVVQNTGRPFLAPSVFARPRAPILADEAENKTYYLLPTDAPLFALPPQFPTPLPADAAVAGGNTELPLFRIQEPEVEETEAVLAIRRAVAEKSAKGTAGNTGNTAPATPPK
jgi:hypothetical protein